MVYDGSNLHGYYDGRYLDTSIPAFQVAFSSPYSVGVVNPSEDDPFRMGRDYWGLCLDGWIDEMAIFNRALTADEVKQHYKMGRP